MFFLQNQPKCEKQKWRGIKVSPFREELSKELLCLKKRINHEFTIKEIKERDLVDFYKSFCKLIDSSYKEYCLMLFIRIYPGLLSGKEILILRNV